jgi:hypothetical protein
MSGLDASNELRRVAPLILPAKAQRASVTAPPPALVAVNPADLVINTVYQRSLSRRSHALIARIVAGWDWTMFKPPVCVETAAGFEVIDGQHTAIAAVTLGLPSIPVLAVQAQTVAGRAAAFVSHNRNRVTMSPLSLHHAAVAAGDERALDIANVVNRAGVRVLRTLPANGRYQPGDLVALSGVRMLVHRYGVMKARQVLEVCVKAKLAPIQLDAIKAVARVLLSGDFGTVSHDDLAMALRSPDLMARAKAHADRVGLRVHEALAIVLGQMVARHD